MKTIQELRDKKLDILKGSVLRPRMYAHDQYGVENHFLSILYDLSFIDDRESDLEIQLDTLREKGLMSPQRVAGRLPDYFSEVQCFSNEISSIYAEIAYNLGYLTLENLFVTEKWEEIYLNINDLCRNQDQHVNDIITQFGKPSIEIGTIWRPIHAYVCDDHKKGWICFDYWNEDLNNFDSEPDNRFKFKTNPILRNVRLPKELFKNGIVYTPYGNSLK
jgi:hypothetical protein